MVVGGQRHFTPEEETRYPLQKTQVGPRAGLEGCGKQIRNGILIM